MSHYRIMTFNLKNDASFLDNENARSDIAAFIINENYPDILGTQELTNSMKDALGPKLKGYKSVGKRRSKNDSKSNERCDVFYNEKRFDLLTYRTFWLTKNPEKKGSKQLLSLFPRICTFVQLQEKQTKNILYVFNTHLDFLLPYIRTIESRILMEHIVKYANNDGCIIVMGDMNTNDNSTAIKTLTNNDTYHLKTTYTTKVEGTIHSKDGSPTLRTLPIDYILISDNLDIVDTQVIKTKVNNTYPSDHFPVLSIVKEKTNL